MLVLPHPISNGSRWSQNERLRACQCRRSEFETAIGPIQRTDIRGHCKGLAIRAGGKVYPPGLYCPASSTGIETPNIGRGAVVTERGFDVCSSVPSPRIYREHFGSSARWD